MRILMLSDLYPPIIGGMELHVRNLSGELVRRGHGVAVATLWHAGSVEREIDRGARVYRLRGTVQRMAGLFSDAGRRFAPPCADPEVMLALRRIVVDERPDIVHAHSWLVHSFVPLKSRSKPGLVVTLHDYSLSCPKKTLMFRGSVCSGPRLLKCLGCCIDHYGLAKALPTLMAHVTMRVPERAVVDMFLPVSQAVAEGNALGAGKLPHQVVPNFIPDDIAESADISAELLAQLPDREFIVFVGALGRHKGIDVLLNAYAALTNPPPLVLIGPKWADSPTSFPPGVVVLENWPHTAVMKAWSRCAIGVIPSVWPEPCPTVLMEAMAAGRPVIATRIGGIPDLVVDGTTGILVPPEDVSALQHALEQLLGDSELRVRMGAAGKQHLGRFKASTVVPRIERVYEQILLGRQVKRVGSEEDEGAHGFP